MEKAGNNLANKIMRYGVWHGRGYSNGWNTSVRRFSDDEKRAPGIDAYDNFVAKAHDLNEIVAEELLRGRLAGAGFQDLDNIADNGHWDFVLESKGGRVLDFEHYYGQAATPEAKRQVADAFAMYESQFMRSNLQYAGCKPARRGAAWRGRGSCRGPAGRRPASFPEGSGILGGTFQKNLGARQPRYRDARPRKSEGQLCRARPRQRELAFYSGCGGLHIPARRAD